MKRTLHEKDTRDKINVFHLYNLTENMCRTLQFGDWTKGGRIAAALTV